MKIKATIETSQPTVSPVDALWALYQSQTKKVRDAFRMRVVAEKEELVTKRQQAMVKESLTIAFEELRSGKVHQDAYKLFDE